MIWKVIILVILIVSRLYYSNMIMPIVNNEIYMLQLTDGYASYMLMTLMQHVNKVFFGICLVLIIFIGIDVYKYFYEKKENKNEENY